MNIIQQLFHFFIAPIITLLIIVMIAYMIFSWLIAFNVINLRNPAVAQIFGIIQRIVEPILTPLRRVIPPLGGLDMAFLVAILILYWLQWAVSPGGMFWNLVG